MASMKMITRDMLIQNGDAWFGEACEKIADGETMTSICRQSELSVGVVMLWIEFMPDRKRQYERALELFAEARAHKSIDVADSADKESWQVSKLQVDTNMRIAGKWNRERYGEKSTSVTNNTVILGDATLKAAQALLAKTGTQDITLKVPEIIDVTPDAA